MSCGCSSGSSYDGGIYGGVCDTDTPYPSVSHESVPSLIDNLVYALYGAITKDVTSGKVVWNIPCDPSNIPATINGIPRNDGEGLLCYIVRALNLTTPSGFVTVNGVQTLTNKTLTAPVINTATINNLTATGILALPTGSITSAMIANGAIVPSDLSTGGPSWDATGNVGIGTSSPAVKLDVVGSMAVRSNLTIGTNLQLVNTSASGGNWTISSQGTSGSGALVFFDETAALTRLYIEPSGLINANGNPITNCPTTAKAWGGIQAPVNTSGASQTITGYNLASIVRGATAGLYTITISAGTFVWIPLISVVSSSNNAGSRIVTLSGNTCTVQCYVGATATDMQVVFALFA